MAKAKKKSQTPAKKKGTIKGVILIVVGAGSVVLTFYLGADIKGFFALITGLVLGLWGATYLWTGKGKSRKKAPKKARQQQVPPRKKESKRES
jgi:hypothetical protein